MHKLFSAIGAAAIALGIGLTSAVPSVAAPLVPIRIETKSTAENVGYRNDWRRRHYYRYGYERRHHRRDGWNYGYSRRHQSGDYWEGINGRRGYGHHRRHNDYPRFGIYFD